MSNLAPIQTKSAKVVRPHKAIISAQLDARTVLTQSPWEFVSLWLKREKQPEALILWNQAREFHEVARGLSLQSAPLLLYYSFMNAAKSLLTAKSVPFNPHHGIKRHDVRGMVRTIKLSNEGIKIKAAGVLPALSKYLQESETSVNHTLKEILFNLPYIHRTYCLTYRSQRDMFVPLTDCRFVFDPKSGETFFSGRISSDFPLKGVQSRLPATLQMLPSIDKRALRSVASVRLTSPLHPNLADLKQLAILNSQLRLDLQYINATQTLWYAKLVVPGSKRISRYPITLTLAAMHRLSEICRYRPLEMHSFMSSQENWLLSEFIQSAPDQFLDAIASELTGYQFLLPNVRPPN